MMLSLDGIKDLIVRLVLEAPENSLVDFGGQAVFDAPLVGYSDGDNPIFSRFRECVSPHHFMPRDVLAGHSAGEKNPEKVCVISWVLPFTDSIRRSNRTEGEPSKLYSLARNNGGALNHRLSAILEQKLRGWGFAAVSPILSESYDAFRDSEHVFSSTWSERHVAFATGLGFFGLNGALITRLGAHVRFGSIVANLPFPEKAVPERDFRAPCLKDGGHTCGLCIARCPAGAISAGGLNKEKCYEMRKAIRRHHLEHYAAAMHMIPVPIVKSGKKEAGYSLGCALCQCGVPCENRDPFEEKGE